MAFWLLYLSFHHPARLHQPRSLLQITNLYTCDITVHLYSSFMCVTVTNLPLYFQLMWATVLNSDGKSLLRVYSELENVFVFRTGRVAALAIILFEFQANCEGEILLSIWKFCQTACWCAMLFLGDTAECSCKTVQYFGYLTQNRRKNS